jgi:hypothetical protein
MAHSDIRTIKTGQLADLVSYDGGWKDAASAVKQLVNAGSTHKMVQVVSATSASATIDSSELSVPANCIVTGVAAVVTEELKSNLAANVGVSFGQTTAGNTHFTGTLDVDSLEATTTNVSGGLANSNVAHWRNGDTATLAIATSKNLMTGSADVYGRVKASTGGFSEGQVAFIVEYLSLDSGSVG